MGRFGISEYRESVAEQSCPLSDSEKHSANLIPEDCDALGFQ